MNRKGRAIFPFLFPYNLYNVQSKHTYSRTMCKVEQCGRTLDNVGFQYIVYVGILKSDTF